MHTPTLHPVEVNELSHSYGSRLALDRVSFHVDVGEIFALLGPNGGGKTTLFKVLCTSLRPSSGRAAVAGHDVVRESDRVRRLIGVVFQSPSLDGKLSVRENLRHHGYLYGLRGSPLTDRVESLLGRFGLADRARERVERLSGGLARRVDLVRGLLHRPRVLLLDEPSTGLDPQARREFWRFIDEARRDEGVTVLLTTHYLDEADRCERVAIIDAGRLVAADSPEVLKRGIAGECLALDADDPQSLADDLAKRFDLTATLVDGRVRVEHPHAHRLISDFMETFGERVRSVSLSRPTLEEVFIHHTGRRWVDGAEGQQPG